MMSLNTGAPHFRSIAKQHRHANYTLEKVINEAVDNIIKKATEIHLTTDVDSDGRLQELKISDNYVSGFESINQEGIGNPFNMGHIKMGHDVDDETSEFGVGLKAGALSAANELMVVSNVNSAYYQVICDFLKMEKEEDVNASYNPKIKTITEADYKQLHPFPNGSSIIMSKIRDTICDRTTQRELTDRLKKGISETYSRFFTQNMRIFVNGELVAKEVDFFSDPKCVHFTVKKRLYVLEKGSDKIFIMSKTIENPVWQIYIKDADKGKWETLKQPGQELMAERIKEGYKYAYPSGSVFSDGSCMDIDTIFTFYSDLFHTKETKETDVDEMSEIMPSDMVQIYKDNRKYGKKSFKKHNNGHHNYTLHRIDFSSKKIGKELGITFNKDITMEGKNDIIMAIRAAVDDSRSTFTADTTTGVNEKLCEKALKKGVLNLTTCKIKKLSKTHKALREKCEAEERMKEELRKKKEADDLRKQMETDILRKKQEAEEAAKAEKERLSLETERLRLEAEKLRLEKLSQETPEERSARLVAEKEQELKAEKEKQRVEKERQKAEKEKQRAEQERLKAEQERQKAEQERDAAIARERLEQEKIAAEKEKDRKQKAKEEEQKQLAIRQEEARQRLRETIAYIKSISEDKLEDTEGILSNVRNLLQI